MIAPISPAMNDVLSDYIREHYWITPSAAAYYRTMLAAFTRWHGGPIPVSNFNATLLRDFLRASMEAKLSTRTVNDRRQVLLMIWEHGNRKGLCGPIERIPKVKNVKRAATAWDTAELQRLLTACAGACPVGSGVSRWLPSHWRALCLTAYDTALRIGTLLTLPRSACDVHRRVLIVPGELTKQRADSIHSLHQQTADSIAELPHHDMLFPWPQCRREIWKKLDRILKDAGLPNGRRDKFHRIRRTSFTGVYKALGPLAAQQHAGHATDMSRFYLDVSKLDRIEPVSVLPRP